MKRKTIVGLSLIAFVALLYPAAIRAQTFSVIHAFEDSEGGAPYAGVTLNDGILYGTFYGNPFSGGGGVYQVTRQGDIWVTTPIYFFAGKDGWEAAANVAFSPDGHLYSTTWQGGANNDGTVFRLVPSSSFCKIAKCFPWKQDALHSFQNSVDGRYPLFGNIVFDPTGNIYGTNIGGGPSDGGLVYQLQPAGDNWTSSVLYSFKGNPDGRVPYGGVVRDNSGNLFGTTAFGGSGEWGTIYKLTYIVGVGWKETVIYTFQNTTDGQAPVASLVLDASGNLYGSTTKGGSPSAGGGTIFELSPSGDSWTFQTLYTFSRDKVYNCGPFGALAMDSAGNLYGTTSCNGATNQGNVFKLTNTGHGWTYTSLHDFTGGSDGAMPLSNVIIDMDGTLYGTASLGGSFDGLCGSLGVNGCGVVWMIKP